MNLLIFLDLTYNPGKNFKFYSLQGQNFKIFLIFTYNQRKVFLILPIYAGGHVYLVSIGSCPPPPPPPVRTKLYQAFSLKHYNLLETGSFLIRKPKSINKLPNVAI